MAQVTIITTSLFKCNRDLCHIYSICGSAFELEFWKSRIQPILFELDLFLLHNATTAFRCRTMVEGVMLSIRRFRSVYGTIKLIYKILEETRDLLRGYEIAKKPITAESLFDLSARVVRKHKNLEAYLHKCNPNFPKKFGYTYNNFFNHFMTLHMREYNLGGKKKGYEVNFCSKVADTIIEIDRTPTLLGKINIAKKFIKRCEALKTPSFRKSVALVKFRWFVKIYEKYL